MEEWIRGYDENTCPLRVYQRLMVEIRADVPGRPKNSPAFTSREISSSALTPGNVFVMERMVIT